MSIDTIRAALARHADDWQGYPAITAAEARAAVAEADYLRDRLMRERDAALRVSNQEVLDRVNEIAKPLIDGLVAERDRLRSALAGLCSATGAESFEEIDRLWAAARAALEEQS
jgi:hypothetical protein